MRIYVASNSGSQARMQVIKKDLEALGHVVCSSWLQEKGAPAMDRLSDEQRRGLACRDLGEIVTADLLIVDTFESADSTGREVEYGAAMALGKKVWRVGPARNIFHTVARKTFSDWKEALGELRR